MKLQILLGKSYLLDKKTNLVHDLTGIKSDRAFESKVVPECTKLIKKIKWRHRKYLTFNKFVALWAKGDLGGCTDCLPGFKIKTKK